MPEIECKSRGVREALTLQCRSGRVDLSLRFENDVVTIVAPSLLFTELKRERSQGILIDNGSGTEIVGVEEPGKSRTASVRFADKSIISIVPIEGVFQFDRAEICMISRRKTGDVFHPRRRSHGLVLCGKLQK